MRALDDTLTFEITRQLVRGWQLDPETGEPGPFNIPTGPLHDAIRAADAQLGDKWGKTGPSEAKRKDALAALPTRFVALAGRLDERGHPISGGEYEVDVPFPHAERVRLVGLIVSVRDAAPAAE